MTRKRRYLISAVVLAACVGIVIGGLAMLPPRPRVSVANIDRIERGMSRAEALLILGEPTKVEDDGSMIWDVEDGRRLGIGFKEEKCDYIGFDSRETFLEWLQRQLPCPQK